MTIDEAWARPGLPTRIAMAALAVVVALAIFAVVSVVWKSGAAIRTATQGTAPALPKAIPPSPVEVSLLPSPPAKPARPASATGASH
ncbi:MAG: hypothetical protein ABIZ18_08035 [Caldimonas sp.]